ncbi:zinc-binding dehydrogenase [Lasiosphaeria ovina]|uniref:Zinc-binding dehydrogenase n=1 Tax=Lasiosphaeria ovina TaxID=92902 RepID=A0AAE0JTR6_9PEZI|nr:zinc-binding dehydrogenase [Lasiosphaeria ovina]
MPENQAAWLPKKGAYPLEVNEAPYTAPGPGQLVIKNAAVAINPVDWAIQKPGIPTMSYLKYPAILGDDVAGEVVAVGPGPVGELFRVGDRVLGCAAGQDKRCNDAVQGAFQTYPVLQSIQTAKIPDSIAYEAACVLPLALSTAASALFLDEYVGLAYPTSPRAEPNGQTVVIWGASTSVGSCAVQLARSAGYDVIATASPKNFDYVRGLGAKAVFDYRSKTAVADILKAIDGRPCAGAVALGAQSMGPCLDIVGAAPGVTGKDGTKKRKFVTQISGPVNPEALAEATALTFVGLIFQFVWFGISTAVRARVRGVQYKFVWGSDLVETDLAAHIYNTYLPAALASGEFVPAPEPHVVGRGLDKIQDAFEVCKKGMSAKKVVVSL